MNNPFWSSLPDLSINERQKTLWDGQHQSLPHFLSWDGLHQSLPHFLSWSISLHVLLTINLLILHIAVSELEHDDTLDLG